MATVRRIYAAGLHPRAECLGEVGVEGGEECSFTLEPGSLTLGLVKQHVRNHPTHEVGVIHETRSLYAWVP